MINTGGSPGAQPGRSMYGGGNTNPNNKGKQPAQPDAPPPVRQGFIASEASTSTSTMKDVDRPSTAAKKKEVVTFPTAEYPTISTNQWPLIGFNPTQNDDHYNVFEKYRTNSIVNILLVDKTNLTLYFDLGFYHAKGKEKKLSDINHNLYRVELPHSVSSVGAFNFHTNLMQALVQVSYRIQHIIHESAYTSILSDLFVGSSFTILRSTDIRLKQARDSLHLFYFYLFSDRLYNGSNFQIQTRGLNCGSGINSSDCQLDMNMPLQWRVSSFLRKQFLTHVTSAQGGSVNKFCRALFYIFALVVKSSRKINNYNYWFLLNVTSDSNKVKNGPHTGPHSKAEKQMEMFINNTPLPGTNTTAERHNNMFDNIQNFIRVCPVALIPINIRYATIGIIPVDIHEKSTKWNTAYLKVFYRYIENQNKNLRIPKPNSVQEKVEEICRQMYEQTQLKHYLTATINYTKGGYFYKLHNININDQEGGGMVFGFGNKLPKSKFKGDDIDEFKNGNNGAEKGHIVKTKKGTELSVNVRLALRKDGLSQNVLYETIPIDMENDVHAVRSYTTNTPSTTTKLFKNTFIDNNSDATLLSTTYLFHSP